MSKALDKVKKLQSELNANIVERSSEIEGALAALLVGQHVLFLGAPGTAKSLLAKNICQAIDGGKFFAWLLTKFSNQEELFGPPSLKGLENDEYRRITKGKLPECTVGFLDEIFKANSAILNSLLTVLQEREFHNNGTPTKIPLLTCFGASNELPQGDELGALYDRFLIRYWISDIKDDNNFKKLLRNEIGNKSPTVQLTLDDLKELQQELEKITISDEIIDSLRDIQRQLVTEKGIRASDRRWKMAVGVLKAFALLRGQQEVLSDDLELLADMMWRSPEERKTILEVVAPRANPLNLKAIQILDAAQEQFDKWSKDQNNDKVGIEVNKALRDMMNTVDAELSGREPNKTVKLRSTRDKIVEFKKIIMQKVVGEVK